MGVKGALSSQLETTPQKPSDTILDKLSLATKHAEEWMLQKEKNYESKELILFITTKVRINISLSVN